MGHTSAPANTATGSIFFELDHFERTDSQRLELSGRWYGVRGRRFVRPTLTLMSGEDSVRSLADLEGKPWAAEEGEEWHAAFPCSAEQVRDAQLAVAPDIAVRLPDPGPNGSSPRRLDAVPPPRPTRRARSQRSRRNSETAAPAPAPAASSRPASPTPPRPASHPPELAEARRNLTELRKRVKQLEAELKSTQAERDEVKTAFEKRNEVIQELRQSLSEREAADRKGTPTTPRDEREKAEREAALSQREQALEKRGRALSDREAALGDRNRVLDQREAALSRKGTSLSQRESELGERERELAERDSRLGERDRQLGERDRQLGEREQSLSERPPLVRGVPARSEPATQRQLPRSELGTWLQRAFAMVFLLIPIIALLILTKAI